VYLSVSKVKKGKHDTQEMNPPVQVTVLLCSVSPLSDLGHFHDYQQNCLSSRTLCYNTLFSYTIFRFIQHLLFLSIMGLRVIVNLFLECVQS